MARTMSWRQNGLTFAIHDMPLTIAKLHQRLPIGVLGLATKRPVKYHPIRTNWRSHLDTRFARMCLAAHQCCSKPSCRSCTLADSPVTVPSLHNGSCA
eukprot:6467426-Amphidinium_carterae.1